MEKKKRLGKGLSALISSEEDNLDVLKEINESHFIPIQKIEFSKFQARKKIDNESLRELANSIKQNGLIQPIIIRKKKDTENFELIAGERRLRACKIANLNKIHAILSNLDDRKAFESGLIENLHRDDLTAIEEAEGYNRLMNEFNYTQEKLSSIISKSRSHVANLLRLISLPKKVKQYILDGKLSLGHARCLVNLNNAEDFAKKIIKEELSVRDVEKLFHKGASSDGNEDKTTNKNINIKDTDTEILEKELSLKLGVKLTINDKNNKGNIKIQYRNIQQRENIIKKLIKD